jgi:hypothetical protein
MLWTQVIENRLESPNGLTKTGYRCLSIASTETEFAKHSIQLPLVIGGAGFTRLPKCSEKVPPILLIINPASQEDLSEDQSTTHLDRERARPRNVTENAIQLDRSRLCILLGMNPLQFDLDCG